MPLSVCRRTHQNSASSEPPEPPPMRSPLRKVTASIWVIFIGSVLSTAARRLAGRIPAPSAAYFRNVLREDRGFMVPYLSCPPRQIAPSEAEKKTFMGRRLTQMDADKHLVFISVDRRSSAAICFFLAFSRSWPGGQCSLFQIPTAFFATYSSTFVFAGGRRST